MYTYILCSFSLSLEDLAAWAQVVVALINVFFVFYIFKYQKKKDRTDKITLQKQQDQATRLQWFKELIIQPHLNEIDNFYRQVTLISAELINSPDETHNIGILERIKAEQIKLRKSFVDLLRVSGGNLEPIAKKNLDDLVDEITNAAFDATLDLTNPAIAQQKIFNRIVYSKNDLIKCIYDFRA